MKQTITRYKPKQACAQDLLSQCLKNFSPLKDRWSLPLARIVSKTCENRLNMGNLFCPGHRSNQRAGS